LTGGWKVVGSDFAGAGGLRLERDFERGTRFACPECGAQCPVRDTVGKRWRHLDFRRYRTEPTARVPRVRCPEHGVRRARAPWAGPGSGFTLMMEAMIMLLCQRMPVAEAAEMLGEQDTRLGRAAAHSRRRDGREARPPVCDQLRGRADRGTPVHDPRQGGGGLRGVRP